MELDIEYNFDKPGIRDSYEIPSNPKKFEKIKKEKKEKEKKKKKKKIKKVRFSNIEDKEAKIKIKIKTEVPVKKKRKRINYKVKKFSAVIFGVLKNLSGFLKLGEIL